MTPLLFGLGSTTSFDPEARIPPMRKNGTKGGGRPNAVKCADFRDGANRVFDQPACEA
jgi:hypothetical protein